MERETISIRPAKNTYEDGIAFSRFMDMASEGGIRKAFGRKFDDIIATAFLVPNHDLSYTNAYFAEQEGKIVGMVSGYTAEQHRDSSKLPLKRASGNRFRRMVGLLLLGLFSRIVGRIGEEAYYIEFVAVDDSVRGQGIGTELLAYMEKQAESIGRPIISLDVSAKNHGAKRLYKKYGFEVVSEWPKLSILPRMLYRMDKVIAKF